MAIARTRIKHGDPAKDAPNPRGTVTTIQAGEKVDLPKDALDALPGGVLLDESNAKKRAAKIDMDDNGTLGTVDAAVASILRQPDHSARPDDVEGVDRFKVAQGGPFGVETGPPPMRMERDESLEDAQARHGESTKAWQDRRKKATAKDAVDRAAVETGNVTSAGKSSGGGGDSKKS